MAVKPDANQERRRAFYITEKAIDEESRTVRVAFSSEKPVLTHDRKRGQTYLEILDHGESVRLDRMTSGAPVLKDHDKLNQVGVVESAEIDKAERMGRATLRFSKSARGEEEFQDVKDGIRTKVSFGYLPGKGEREPSLDQDGVPAFRFRSWQPYEISTVSIPEDDSVGVGRDFKGGDGIPSDSEDAEPEQDQTTNQTRTMATEAPAAEPKQPEVDVNKLTSDIRNQERERAKALRAFGNRVSIADSEIDKAINDGVEFETFTRSFAEGAIATVKASEGPKAPLYDLEIGLNSKERARFSVVKAMRELSNPRGGLTGLEKEVTDECVRAFKLEDGGDRLHIPTDIMVGDGRRRDLEAGVSAEGGYTVATDLGGMIDLLRNKAMVLQLGATQLTGLKGNLSLPRLDGAATASWVDEEGSVSETAQTFGQLALTPNRLAARTAFSDQLLAQSSVSVENVVRADLMRVTAIELDRAALHGSGASNQPLGLDGTSGIGSVTFGGAPTWADVVEFETDVAAANGMIGSASFLTSAAVRGKWKTTVKVASTDSRFLCENNEANGYPLYVSENVTGNIVFFGVWPELIVATWGAMSVIVDPYSKAQTGQRVVTVCSFHDIACRQPSAFSVSTDAGNQ